MKRILFSLLLLVGAYSQVADAQCRAFSKKKCMPSLSPYVTNGQINTGTFFPGDHAEIPLSFFENTSYRIIVCNQEILGKISFKVLDAAKNTVFDNKGLDYVSSWDFKSMSNQSLTLVIDVPKGEESKHGMVSSGCVSVIIGFKKS